MDLNGRWKRVRADLAPESRERADALLAASRILGVGVAQLAELTADDWWQVACAVDAGNLHGEGASMIEWSALKNEQVQRIIDGERPSLVIGAAV